MIVAGLAGALSLSAGLVGFKLVPDTVLYTRPTFDLWPAPLVAPVGSLYVLIVLSALAAAVCVYLIPSTLDKCIFALVTAYWFAFPGVDALGLLFVLLMLRTGQRRWWPLSFLAHPVAALTSAPLLWRRDALGVGLVAILTVATIGAVGLLDGFSTTDRYALVLAGTLAVRP